MLSAITCDFCPVPVMLAEACTFTEAIVEKDINKLMKNIEIR